MNSEAAVSATGRLAAAAATLLAAGLLLAGCERPPMNSTQIGYRGLGMEQVSNPRLAAAAPKQALPVELPRADVPEGTPLAGDAFQNVQVLKDVPVPEFTRLMAAMTTWVAPQQGCTYCHDTANLAADTLYTKVVARRMLEMTRHINGAWHPHVGATGVTCYTCHRGNNVPQYVWFRDPGPAGASATAGNLAGQNAPAPAVRYASLPNDPFSTFLGGDARNIAVVSSTALREDGMGASIKHAEDSYGLMMHITQALGVNCTFCHNSRSFFAWDQSTPQRATAWYGIRMARDLNAHYLGPLQSTFPPNRLGPTGDSPKVNCLTCHQGLNKPLHGASLLSGYPELGGAP